MLAQLSGTICLKHSATLILPPLSKPPSRRTCLIINSKLFFTALPIPSSDTVCVCVCVVSVIVKRPVLPPSVVDGRSRNPLYYYYYYVISGHRLNFQDAMTLHNIRIQAELSGWNNIISGYRLNFQDEMTLCNIRIQAKLSGCNDITSYQDPGYV